MAVRATPFRRYAVNTAFLLAAGASFSCMSGGGLSRARDYDPRNDDPRVVEIEAFMLRGDGAASGAFEALSDHSGLVTPRDLKAAREAIMTLASSDPSVSSARGVCTVQNKEHAEMRMRRAGADAEAGPLVVALDADILHKDEAKGGIRLDVGRLAFEGRSMSVGEAAASCELAEFVGAQLVPDGGGVVLLMEQSSERGRTWSLLALFADASSTE